MSSRTQWQHPRARSLLVDADQNPVLKGLAELHKHPQHQPCQMAGTDVLGPHLQHAGRVCTARSEDSAEVEVMGEYHMTLVRAQARISSSVAVGAPTCDQ